MRRAAKKGLFVLTVIFVGMLLFLSCAKQQGEKVSEIAPGGKVAGEEYAREAERFFEKLEKAGHTFSRYENTHHEYVVIDLNGDEEARVWVYLIGAQSLQYFDMDQDDALGGDDGNMIYMPDGEGAWHLPLYANDEKTLFMAVLTSSFEDIGEQEIVELF